MSLRRATASLVALATVGALLTGCSPSSPKVSSTGTTSTPVMGDAPSGDLPGWYQTFREDFPSGDVTLGSWPGQYGDRWDAYPEPWRDTSGNGIYSPARVLSISHGVLDMYLHSEQGQPYVAAPEPRLNGPDGRGQRYGRYSVRFRADAVPGYKTAWLLWPDSNRRREGEIDFPEANLDSTINGCVHKADHNRGQQKFPTGKTFAKWHIATIEWVPGRVTFILDGKTIGTTTKKVPSEPMHWVLQTETEIDGRRPSHSAAGHVQVDWVAAYDRR